MAADDYVEVVSETTVVIAVKLGHYSDRAAILEELVGPDGVDLLQRECEKLIVRNVSEIDGLFICSNAGSSSLIVAPSAEKAIQFSEQLQRSASRRNNSKVFPVARWCFQIGIAFHSAIVKRVYSKDKKLNHCTVAGWAADLAIDLRDACQPGCIEINATLWTELSEVQRKQFEPPRNIRASTLKPPLAYRRPLVSDSFTFEGTVVEFFHIQEAEPENLFWSEGIASANRVDICVQGWDWWAQRYNGVFEELFRRGGHVNLFVPDPADEDQLGYIAERLTRGKDDQQREIRITCKAIRTAWTNAFEKEKKGSLHVFYLKVMTWYCAVRILSRSTGSDILVLSLYEHIRRRDSENKIKSPFYQIPLYHHPGTAAWIDKEIEGLKDPLRCSRIEKYPETNIV